MKVKIKYSFIFDPDEAWNAKSDLANDVNMMLANRGLEAEIIVDPGAEEGSSDVTMFVRRTQAFTEKGAPPEPPGIRGDINKLVGDLK